MKKIMIALVMLAPASAVYAGDLESKLIDNDAVTIDHSTQLMWAQDGAGAGCNNSEALSWNEAKAYCESLKFASYTDWRMPAKNELFSIAGNGYGVRDRAFFPNTVKYWYWNTEDYDPDSITAKLARKSHGLVGLDNNTGAYFIRCVRTDS
ncbi:MAG: DUF1566 domain-containing protein [Elusimicrobiales bacterium]|jgi:hypothetical protein